MVRISVSTPLAVSAIGLRPRYPLAASQRKFTPTHRRYSAGKSLCSNVNSKPTTRNFSPLATPSRVLRAGLSSTAITQSTQVSLTPPTGPPWPTVLYIPRNVNKSVSGNMPPSPLLPDSGEPGKPKKKRSFRNALLVFTFLIGLSFAGGVYYSLKSDNFHDFFTEYIPFGEEVVLYFEDREFRKRFPNALTRVRPKKEESRVTIPQRSGATWKIHEPEVNAPKVTDLGSVGPHVKSAGPKAKKEEKKEAPTVVSPGPTQPKMVGEKPIPSPSGPAIVEAAQKAAVTRTNEDTVPLAHPAVSLRQISPLELSHDMDPAVKDLTRAVNSIISLANDPKDTSTFNSAVSSAKVELERLNGLITNTRKQTEEIVSRKLHEQELEFAKVAQGILSRVDQEAEKIRQHYLEEIERIKENIADAYREKLHTELGRTAQVSEQRTQNELLEQAIEMKRRFIQEIKSRVEEERDGRLGKLEELADTIKELEAVTSKWADVVESSFKTQKLHVAVEAVRDVINDPLQPRPFIRELAALKEVAGGGEVVRATIASINPRAYQRGVSSHAQLTDRFRRVREEVRKAALLPEDAGVAGHATSWLLSKLLFKKSGLAIGEDVESILTRTETFLEEGDLDSAAREMNQLQGWSKVLARDWLREARLLLEVKQAIDVICIQARLQALKSA